MRNCDARSVVAAVMVCLAIYAAAGSLLWAAPEQNARGGNPDRVSGEPVITAKPERVTLSDGRGSTHIEWDTGDGSMGFVFVTEDGGKPVLERLDQERLQRQDRKNDERRRHARNKPPTPTRPPRPQQDCADDEREECEIRGLNEPPQDFRNRKHRPPAKRLHCPGRRGARGLYPAVRSSRL